MPQRYHTRILFQPYVFALSFLFFCRGRYRLLDRLMLHEFFHLSQLVLDKSGEVPANWVNCDFTYPIGPWWSLTAKPLALYVVYRARNNSFPHYSLNILRCKNTSTSNKCCCWVTNIWKIKNLPKQWKILQTFNIYKNVFEIYNIPPVNICRNKGRRQCKYGYKGKVKVFPLQARCGPEGG